MTVTFIIGATGGTGLRLGEALARSGNQPVGLHRKPEQALLLQTRGIRPVAGDLLAITAEELAILMAEADSVVFTAGSGGGGDDLTDAIDGQGVVLASRAATMAGVRRFILVSAFPDAWRERRMPPDFEHYMFVKRQADVHLAQTGLDWIILRPGTLLESKGTSEVRIGVAIPYGSVSRDDVAAVIAALLAAPRVNRIILELTEGTVPIRLAVAGLPGAGIQPA